MNGLLENFDDITGKIVSEMEKAAPRRWDEVFVDITQPIPAEPPFLAKIGETAIIFRQGLTVISGVQKAGKTSWVRLLIVAVLCGKALDIEAVPGVKVLWFDCEQPLFRILRQVEKAFQMAGMDRTNEGPIQVAALRQYSPEERLGIIKETIADRRPDVVIIDGVTDLLQDPNDLAASGTVVAELLAISEEFDTGIVVVCHTNPNPNQTAGKLRGHIGSELMRKCETSIGMEKNDLNVFTCKCKDSRGRPFAPFSFTKDENDNILPTVAPVAKKKITAKDQILAAMEPGKTYTSAELESYVAKPSSGRTAVRELKDAGLIRQVERGVYEKCLDAD